MAEVASIFLQVHTSPRFQPLMQWLLQRYAQHLPIHPSSTMYLVAQSAAGAVSSPSNPLTFLRLQGHLTKLEFEGWHGDNICSSARTWFQIRPTLVADYRNSMVRPPVDHRMPCYDKTFSAVRDSNPHTSLWKYYSSILNWQAEEYQIAATLWDEVYAKTQFRMLTLIMCSTPAADIGERNYGRFVTIPGLPSACSQGRSVTDSSLQPTVIAGISIPTDTSGWVGPRWG